MSTKSHPKRRHFVDIFVHEMSPKVSTRCHPFCPRNVTYYVHEMSATRLSPPVCFYSLRPLSKLRRALLKLFTLGGNLFKLSLATYSVRFINESWEFVYDRTPRHKCKTPSSGTACFAHFLSPHRTVRGGLSAVICSSLDAVVWFAWILQVCFLCFTGVNKSIRPCVLLMFLKSWI